MTAPPTLAASKLESEGVGGIYLEQLQDAKQEAIVRNFGIWSTGNGAYAHLNLANRESQLHGDMWAVDFAIGLGAVRMFSPYVMVGMSTGYNQGQEKYQASLVPELGLAFITDYVTVMLSHRCYFSTDKENAVLCMPGLGVMWSMN